MSKGCVEKFVESLARKTELIKEINNMGKIYILGGNDV
jgi:hypothetical protein